MASSHFLKTCGVTTALESLAKAGIEERGAVFTRREVVDFILDLAGYTSDQPLHGRTLLEPSCGEGDFLIPAVQRLLAAYRAHDGDPAAAYPALAPCIRAVELHRSTFKEVAAQLRGCLVAEGVPGGQAVSLAKAWLAQGDFLLAPFDQPFDFGPYLRAERRTVIRRRAGRRRGRAF